LPIQRRAHKRQAERGASLAEDPTGKHWAKKLYLERLLVKRPDYIPKAVARARAVAAAALVVEFSCRTCRIVKPRDAFYVDSSRIRGLTSNCRECVRSSSHAKRRAERANRPPKTKTRDMLAARKLRGLERERLRAERAANRLAHKQRVATVFPTNPRSLGAAKKKRKRGDPFKERVRRILVCAVRSGKILKPTECSKCHWPCNPDGHHADYSKPLEVVWLCRICHQELHRAHRID
jgi:hypothetical protein